MGFFGVVRNSSQTKKRLILTLARGEKRSIECLSLMGEGDGGQVEKKKNHRKTKAIG
jgi:hypothetical protein